MVLNRVAHRVIKAVRGTHPDLAFTYHGGPVAAMNNTTWQAARVGLTAANADARPQAHVWAQTTGRGRVARGPAGSARTQVRSHHHALLGGGLGEPDWGGRGGVGQESRTRVMETKGGRIGFASCLMDPRILVRPERFELPTTCFVVGLLFVSD